MNILHPADDFAKILLPTQKKTEGISYRLMHQVLVQPVEEGVLLYHLLTNCLVLLSPMEAQSLTDNGQLVEMWFLVPEDFQDKKLCAQVIASARLLNRQKKGIRKYTILTTTRCNANCFYCYQKGAKQHSMSEETAQKTAQYIISHHQEHNPVEIDWFGGEPLLNTKCISQICTELQKNGIRYDSFIISNGLLFNEEIIKQAQTLWNLKKIQITLDGREQLYNKAKAYHSSLTSPYQKVIENIGLLLRAGIPVLIRLNIDRYNSEDMRLLIKELADRFGAEKNFSVYIAPLFELIGPQAENRTAADRKRVYQDAAQLREFAGVLGIGDFYTKRMHHKMAIYQCMVDSKDAIMILPDGHLGLCEHHLDDAFFGHIDHDEWDAEVIRKSREYCDEIPECDTCPLYPKCFRLKICGEQDECFPEFREFWLTKERQRMLNEYQRFQKSSCIIFRTDISPSTEAG